MTNTARMISVSRVTSLLVQTLPSPVAMRAPISRGPQCSEWRTVAATNIRETSEPFPAFGSATRFCIVACFAGHRHGKYHRADMHDWLARAWGAGTFASSTSLRDHLMYLTQAVKRSAQINADGIATICAAANVHGRRLKIVSPGWLARCKPGLRPWRPCGHSRAEQRSLF